MTKEEKEFKKQESIIFLRGMLSPGMVIIVNNKGSRTAKSHVTTMYCVRNVTMYCVRNVGQHGVTDQVCYNISYHAAVVLGYSDKGHAHGFRNDTGTKELVHYLAVKLFGHGNDLYSYQV